ncbi:MAG: transporter substrate-binding domain-containing protein [Planctomycetaceae bacterium]
MLPIGSRRLLALLTLTAACLPGCGDMPRDPHETFERARGGIIRVGYTVNPPWVSIVEEGDRTEPAGIEPRLLAGLARRIGGRIEWRFDSETRLIESLERRELDVLIGGFKDSTPWSKKAGLTRPFARVDGDRHVMLVPQGENRWLLELDRFLKSSEAEIKRQDRESIDNRRE